MKRTLLALIYFFVLYTEFSTPAQSTFQNLDFESTTLVSAGPPSVQFAPAFPGWRCNVGTSAVDTALYNTVALDSSAISIIDQGWPHSLTSGGVIEGNYTAIIQAGVTGIAGTPTDTSLSQVGLVPPTALSLRFKAELVAAGPGAFVVQLGGQQLLAVPLGQGMNYTLYGADIHLWAGQTAELDFTLLAGRPHIDNHYAFLDSIEFSDIAIPEPGTTVLLWLGALLVGWRALKKKLKL